MMHPLGSSAWSIWNHRQLPRLALQISCCTFAWRVVHFNWGSLLEKGITAIGYSNPAAKLVAAPLLDTWCGLVQSGLLNRGTTASGATSAFELVAAPLSLDDLLRLAISSQARHSLFWSSIIRATTTTLPRQMPTVIPRLRSLLGPIRVGSAFG